MNSADKTLLGTYLMLGSWLVVLAILVWYAL